MTDEISDHAAGYDFVQLGEGLADSLTRAAEEQVQRAQAILDQTKSMADIIRTQVKAQAKQIEEMNVRFKAFGEQMLDAHRKLNGEARNELVKPANPYHEHDEKLAQHQPATAPADIARLRALDTSIRSGRDEKRAGTDAAAADFASRERERVRSKQRPQGADGRHELPRAVAAGEPYAPWVNTVSDREYDDPGHATKQPDRD